MFVPDETQRIHVLCCGFMTCNNNNNENLFSHAECNLLCWYLPHSFAQTLFSRFVKEMILAADTNHDGKISKSELRNMLKNIGVDQFVSDQDVDAVFLEIGHQEEDGEYLIYTDEIETILTQPSMS